MTIANRRHHFNVKGLRPIRGITAEAPRILCAHSWLPRYYLSKEEAYGNTEEKDCNP